MKPDFSWLEVLQCSAIIYVETILPWAPSDGATNVWFLICDTSAKPLLTSVKPQKGENSFLRLL